MSPAISPTGDATAIHDHNSEMDIEKASIKPPHAQSNILSTALTKITSRSTIHDPGPPPDGGLRAWTVLVFAHLVNFNTWGFSNTFGILQTYYVSRLDRPPSDIAWIGSMQMFLLFFLATFSGRLSDAGYFHQTFLAGTCLFLLGVFGASASTTYWQLFLSNGICTGVGGSLMFCPALSVCGTYFSKKQVLAVSVVAAAANTGGLVYGVVLQQLLPRIGFPWTMRVIGFIAAAMLIPSNFLIRPRKLTKTSGPVVDLVAFRDKPYALFAAGGFFLFLGAWFPYYYLGSFGRNVLHLNSKTASALILIINGCGIAGRIPSALIANLFTGPLNMLVPLTLASAILIFGWIGITSYTGLVIFDIIYGMIMSGTQGLFPSTLSSLTPNLAKLGTRNGMVLSIVSFACLIGPPADGALIQRGGGSYLGAQIFAGLSLLVSMGFFVGARVVSAGWRGDVRV